MKKLIVSMMLIIGMFAFAAESDPSATVGYVKYGNVTTAGSDLNFVALPVDAGYTNVGDFDPTGTNMNSISKWDATSQGWVATSYNTFISSWLGDFPAVNGQAYMINALGAFDFIVDGPVVALPAYNLITTAGSDLNFIMHPLTKASLTMAGAGIGDDIGSTNTVSKWDAAAQGWVATSYNQFISSWLSDFGSEIGNPLMVNMTGDVTWPGAKGQFVDNEEPVASKGLTKDCYFEVVDNLGASYTFPDADVTAKAWMTARPAELITTNDFIIQQNFGFSVVQLNAGNFATAWATGDVLNVNVKHEPSNLEGLNAPVSLDTGDLNPYFAGPSLGGADPAIQTNTPSSIEGGMVPEVTKLHQNYPNPFNPTTSIKFDLASNTDVKLNVYNYNGQMVKSLVSGQMNAGYHTVNFDAANLSAGV